MNVELCHINGGTRTGVVVFRINGGAKTGVVGEEGDENIWT